ncbi:RdgB/HAM1 family non-canonical purine NTP pyrophosphatase [Guggenheimella bovis]
MKTIVFATQNSGKVEEMRFLVKDWGIELLSLKDLGITVDIEENGETYLENARIKAEAIKKLTDHAVLSDDSGLEVKALGNRPGIHSARYGGDIPFEEKRKKLIEEVEGALDRSARFISAVVLLDGETVYEAQGEIPGSIGTEEKGENGFGYDSIFVLEDGRHFAELTFEEKQTCSHRYYAMKALEELLREDRRI